MVAATGSRPGASRRRARRPARTSELGNSSWQAATSARRSRAKDHVYVALIVEGSLRRWLSAAQGGSLARVGPSRGDQDLEPAFDHSAAVRRSEFRRL